MIRHIFQLAKQQSHDSPTLRHNLIAHIADGSLFGFALCFMSAQTIVPVFVREIGGGVIAIGSVPVLWMLGNNLPQIALLPLTHRPGLIKPILILYLLLMLIFFLLLALFASVVVGRIPAELAVPLFLLLFFVTSLAGSLGTPPWFQLFTRTTPVLLRGRLVAVRQLLGALLGIVGGSIITVVLSTMSVPHSFAVLFFITFVLSMCSFYFLRSLIEPPVQERTLQADTGRTSERCMRILRNDPNFRNFLIADALMLAITTASGFYAVFGLERFRESTAMAGTFTMIFMGSMVASNIFFGYLADHYGHRRNLLVLAMSATCASLIAILAGNSFIYGSVFLFMGCTVSVQGISRMSFVAEFCADDDRPMYVAITNTLTAPALLAGIGAGALIKHVGYEMVFSLYCLLGILATFWIMYKVHDPRHLIRT